MMNKEKLRAFLGITNKTPESEALEKQMQKLEDEAAAMRELVETRGWKLLDEFFTMKKNIINQELRMLDPWKEAGTIARCQEKYKIMEELYNFINAKIIRGA